MINLSAAIQVHIIIIISWQAGEQKSDNISYPPKKISTQKIRLCDKQEKQETIQNSTEQQLQLFSIDVNLVNGQSSYLNGKQCYGMVYLYMKLHLLLVCTTGRKTNQLSYKSLCILLLLLLYPLAIE